MYIYIYIYMYVCMCMYLSIDFSFWEPIMLRNILLDRIKTGAYIYIYINNIYIYTCVYIYTHNNIHMYVANRRKQQHEMWVCLNNYPKTATLNKAHDDKPTSTPCHLHLPHRLITKKNEPEP